LNTHPIVQISSTDEVMRDFGISPIIFPRFCSFLVEQHRMRSGEMISTDFDENAIHNREITESVHAQDSKISLNIVRMLKLSPCDLMANTGCPIKF
jgi:hypothetical protein